MAKGILVTSFGTTYLDTRKKSIEVIENLVKEKYGEDKVERAFTSNIVRKVILKNENLKINDHIEGVEALKAKGYDEIVTMSLHIIPGSEYKTKINHEVSEVTEPLLKNDEDFVRVVNDEEINDTLGNDVLIFMGHGSEDIADETYNKLQKVYEEQGKNNIFIGTVEGAIRLEDVLEKIKGKNFKKILLKPYMIVAGDHARNDMGSDEEDSWKTILENKGYEVEVQLKGLGEHKIVQGMFMEKLSKIY